MANEGAGNVADPTFRDFTRGQKLFGRYTLIKVLGRGGMGVVWLARDEELEREVALKFLPDVIVHDRSLLNDLKRETRRSLELTHKNIIRIHDFVFDERSACISMEYVDGDTLANLRSEKERKVFEPNELTDWTNQLCDALDYAHNQARIVHRDLKPANLMVNQKGDLKVSDFGIARNLGDTVSRLTMEQGRSGTLVYMSPQQLNGERGSHLDDIYSLGATLYDLLTSKPPFYSGNIDRQIHERVAPSMTERRKDLNIEPALVPPLWEETVAACLAKDPTKRPQSTAEVAQRLQLSSAQTRTVRPGPSQLRKNKVLLGAGGAILLLVAILGWYFGVLKRHGKPVLAPTAQTAPATVAAAEKSIAVLPFENLSAEKDDSFFADGIQDDVLASLGKIKDLKVIARSSVMIYRGVAVAGKLREIGQALQVSHVLQGSVRRGANRVVINVALIDTRNDNQVWSQHYDRTLNDMLSLQGELAVEIARELQATLTPNEKSTVASKPTKNSEAYVLYLKALDRDRRAASREDGIAADQLYSQAIALDPTFALAVARASIHNSRMYLVGGDPTRKAKARAQAEEALRLSPALGEAHLALALCFYRIDKNYEAALQELSKAAATSPNDPEILDFTGGIYLHQGHWREALANFLRAQELDPNNPYADKQDRDIAGTYVALRDWPAAAAALQRLRQIAPENEPDNVDAQVGLAYVEFFRTGNLAAGKEILHKIPAGLDPNAGVTMARWDFSMLERDFAAAEKILAEYPSEEFPPPMRTPKSYFQGLTALALGDAALAQTLFEKARPSYELGLQNHPDDPRFLARIAMLYAYLGRKEDAIRAARRAVELVPESKDAAEAPSYEESLAGVYARTGEADQAIALIEQLLTKPSALTLAELRLRWEWDPLRSKPRFKKILAGPEPKTIY
jgi:serine/threonine protein kinase/tetratricopeptide (TPR) repeat protein